MLDWEVCFTDETGAAVVIAALCLSFFFATLTATDSVFVETDEEGGISSMWAVALLSLEEVAAFCCLLSAASLNCALRSFSACSLKFKPKKRAMRRNIHREKASGGH